MEKHIHMTHEIIRRYGNVNGDHDTNHYDDSYAQGQGYRGAIAHGLLISGYVTGVAVKKFGPAFHSRGEFEMKYVGAVCPGDELVATITDDGAIECKTQHGLVGVGWIRLRSDD